MSLQLVYIIGLNVSREHAVEKTYERKRLRYAKLTADVQQLGWKVKV